MTRTHHTPRAFSELSKEQLQILIFRMKQGDTNATNLCVIFVTYECRGTWHNRARANICTYLKTHPPSQDVQEQLVSVVCSRLATGYFSEQFSNQLSMAIRFAPDKMHAVATVSGDDSREYVRRYSRRVLMAIESQRNRDGRQRQ